MTKGLFMIRRYGVTRDRQSSSAIHTAEWNKGIVHDGGAVRSIGRDGAQQSVEKLGYDARLDVAHNEHHAAAAVAAGPMFKPGGRVHEMLDGVNHHGVIRMLGQ